MLRIGSLIGRLLGPFWTPLRGIAGPSPTSPAVGNADVEGRPADELLTLVNRARAEAGIGPLVSVIALIHAAATHTQYLARRLEKTALHADPAGPPWVRAEAEGYRWSGFAENVAIAPDPATVLRLWMGDPFHKGNLLGPAYRHVGIATQLAADGSIYWVADFATPSSP